MRLTEAEKKLIQDHRRKNRRKRKPAARKPAAKANAPNQAINQLIANALWFVIVVVLLFMLAAR